MNAPHPFFFNDSIAWIYGNFSLPSGSIISSFHSARSPSIFLFILFLAAGLLFVWRLYFEPTWAFGSDFGDIFDVNHFIKSLKDEVRIVRKLPPKLHAKHVAGKIMSIPPVSWSNESYYLNEVCVYLNWWYGSLLLLHTLLCVGANSNVFSCRSYLW